MAAGAACKSSSHRPRSCAFSAPRPQDCAERMRARFTPLDFALYAGVILSWSFSWIAMHYQVGDVAPEISVVWRFLLAAPVMLAIAAARGESLRFSLSDHAIFVALGFFLFCANFALFYHAAGMLASGLLSVIFSLASVINVWLGA